MEIDSLTSSSVAGKALKNARNSEYHTGHMQRLTGLCFVSNRNCIQYQRQENALCIERYTNKSTNRTLSQLTMPCSNAASTHDSPSPSPSPPSYHTPYGSPHASSSPCQSTS